MLDTFVPAASYADAPDVLREWYDGLVGSLTFPMPADAGDDALVADCIRSLQGR